MNTNTNNTNKAAKNPYGHLLDKYLDSNHVDWETRQRREEEAKNRYGHLLDYARPDNSTLELMAKMEDDRIERQKQMEEDKRLDALRRQERIDAEKRKADEHEAEVRGYAESIIKRKKAKIKAAEMEEAEKRKADERRQGIYDQIDGLMRISPEAADAYIQAMKKAGVI